MNHDRILVLSSIHKEVDNVMLEDMNKTNDNLVSLIRKYIHEGCRVVYNDKYDIKLYVLDGQDVIVNEFIL